MNAPTLARTLTRVKRFSTQRLTQQPDNAMTITGWRMGASMFFKTISTVGTLARQNNLVHGPPVAHSIDLIEASRRCRVFGAAPALGISVATPQTAATPQRQAVTATDVAALQFAPEPAAAPSAAECTATLVQGEPFAAPIDALMQNIFGIPVTREGFERLYSRLMPNATWLVTSVLNMKDGPYANMPENMRDQGVSFVMSGIDRTGKVAINGIMYFKRHADNAIEFYISDADVDMEFRGSALSARSELLQQAILRAISTHPDSRLTLFAGQASNPNSGKEDKAIGVYLHALRGYLFAENYGYKFDWCADSELRCERDVGALRQLSDRDLLAHELLNWVEHDASVQFADAPKDVTLALLRKQVAAMTYPAEFALLDVPGVQAFMDGKHGPQLQPIGKAFMLSGCAPFWRGVRYVGPAADPADQEARDASANILAFETTTEIDKAVSKRAALQARVLVDLDAQDAATRAGAYLLVGRYCTSAARAFLVVRSAVENEPAVRLALGQALAMLDGELIEAYLERAANDPSVTSTVREFMGDRLALYRRQLRGS